MQTVTKICYKNNTKYYYQHFLDWQFVNPVRNSQFKPLPQKQQQKRFLEDVDEEPLKNSRLQLSTANQQP